MFVIIEIVYNVVGDHWEDLLLVSLSSVENAITQAKVAEFIPFSISENTSTVRKKDRTSCATPQERAHASVGYSWIAIL